MATLVRATGRTLHHRGIRFDLRRAARVDREPRPVREYLYRYACDPALNLALIPKIKQEGPRVRIHLPPAASQVRTCLSREFAFLRREAAVFRGCAGRGKRRGRQRRAGRDNIGPTGGNISVGPYSSTAPPVMWAA